MAKKKAEEVKENVVEEVKETTEKVEIVDSNEEKQDVEMQENASNTEQATEVQVTEENLTVKEVFKDRYDSTIIYNVGDVFIEDETLQNNKPTKAEKGKYKVSKERYAELKRSLYVD